MSFLYPGFLWGLLALLIPIIVHLFNFRKAKRVYFSNVAFLERVKQRSSAKLKAKYLLVLACRLLIITSLVFAFAQPFIPGKEKGLDGTSVKIYLDNSQSSSNMTDNDRSGLTTGIAFVEEIINLYPSQTNFQLITNDFAPWSQHAKTKDRVLELTAELDFSNLLRTRNEMASKISAQSSPSSNEDMYIISDFQRSAFSGQKALPKDSFHSLKIIPIRYASNDNLMIDSVYLESPFLISGQLNKLHVKVKNLGKEDASDIILKLFVNQVQGASASLDIDKSSSGELVFDLNFDLQEINTCRISFEDFPITFDNDYYFVLSLLREINIAEVGEANQKSFFRYVYSENPLFSFQRYDYGSIDYGQVQTSDLFIINQLKSMDQSILNAAQDLLDRGKSVLLIPSKSSDTQVIESLVHKTVSLIEAPGKVAIAHPDVSHPFFENIFGELDSKSEMPETSNVFFWAPSSADLLKTRSGQPFLSKISDNGAFYLLAAPLNDEQTNFHKHALFVPVLYRMAALSSSSRYPLSYPIDAPTIELQLDSADRRALFKLVRADEEYIPQQRTVGNKLILDIPKFLLRPGFYDLTYQGETVHTLAFNHAKGESDPSQLNDEELLRAFSSFQQVELVESTDAAFFGREMRARYEGIRLWKYALVLALMFLLTETLLLRFL